MVRIAVDVGGTFTDALVATETGELLIVKIRSTPAAPEEGFLSSIIELLSTNNVSPSIVTTVVHVGTIGTNLFLGQMGLNLPKVALVTTRGFRDVLEIGRQNRPELYNVFFKRPTPLVPRRLRFEVLERVDSHGSVLNQVSIDDLSSITTTLKTENIESVAVSFLNSYLNQTNEKSAQQFISEKMPVPVFSSVNVDPEHREYERTSTTVVNAALAPIVSKYLEAAERGMREARIRCDLQILSSSGGLVDVEEAKTRPILTLESGPAAGVVGTAEISKLLGIKRAISLDMGGTSAKAGCVIDYTPLLLGEIEVGGRVHSGRAVKGSGYPVRYPSIDLAEVSAGGGTIIWSDKIGNLRVGPTSAGASPGPACYGTGGDQPTVTDANLLLGRISSKLLGGKLELSRASAEKALGRVAERVGLDIFQTAAASVKLINLDMAKAVHIVSLERGFDPREFTVVSFGGAGPMHAAELANEVGIRKVIVPPWPGLFSALSMLLSDMKYTYVRGLLSPLKRVEESEIERIFASMTNAACEELHSRRISTEKSSVLRTLDLRYAGQGYELEVEASTPFSSPEASALFDRRHESVYGYSHSGAEIEVTALRLTVNLPSPKVNLKSTDANPKKSPKEPVSKRKCWFNGEWFDTNVYSRDLLPTPFGLTGPAIVEEYDSTIVVPPHWELEMGNYGCLVLRRSGD